MELIDIGVELPEQVTRPLKDVKQSLEAAVDARTFVISVTIDVYYMKEIIIFLLRSLRIMVGHKEVSIPLQVS